ncbi:MAG: GNAT family N-acetyltransferase [Bacteriovoracaceae bacterium]
MTIYLHSFQNIQDDILIKLSELDKLVFQEHWSDSQWVGLKGKEDYYLAYQKIKLEIVTYAIFQVSVLEEMVHLLKVITIPTHRKKGLALQLLSESFPYFRRHQIKRCFLEVDCNNEDAIKLYGYLGFTKLHRIPQFYSNGSDAFTMELHFPLNN